MKTIILLLAFVFTGCYQIDEDHQRTDIFAPQIDINQSVASEADADADEPEDPPACGGLFC